MKLRRLKAEWNNCKYEIEEAVFYELSKKEKTIIIEAYLYVFEEGSEFPVEDHLQNDVEMCMGYALDICHVPKESWIELEPVEEEV